MAILDKTDGKFYSIENFDILDKVIESDSNANGSWVKSADGTMIQHGTIEVHLDVDTPQGSLFYGSSTTDFIVFPIPFIDDNYSISTDETSSYIVWKALRSVTYSKESHRYRNFTYFRGTSVTGAIINVDWVAIGRWK